MRLQPSPEGGKKAQEKRPRGSGDIASPDYNLSLMAELYSGLRLGVCGLEADSIAKLGRRISEHYATQLNTVEVNFTFRQLVKESHAHNWIADTRRAFAFGVKAHQMLTHIKRLKGTADFLRACFLPGAAAGQGSWGRCFFNCLPNMIRRRAAAGVSGRAAASAQGAFEFVTRLGLWTRLGVC